MSDIGIILISLIVVGSTFLLLYLADKASKYDNLSKHLFFINKRIKLMDYVDKKLDETKRDPLNDIDPIEAILRNVGDDERTQPLWDAIRNGEKLVKGKK